MRRCPTAVIAALAGAAAFAQPADPLHSSDCSQALAALQAQEALAASPADPQALQQLEALRRQAARACLGGTGVSPSPSQHLAQPYVALPPAAARPGTSAPAPGATPPATMLKRPPLPPVVTACDDAGCWTSDGSRLQRVGPDLVGPRGRCVREGTALRCP